MTSLKKDSFISLTELDRLTVWSSGVRTIELGAFNGLTNLKRLFIGDNEISEIITGTFENMNSLEVLSLLRNRLEHLDSDVFSGLFNLKYIYLSSNKLQYLHPDTFLSLPNLQKLNLNNNTELSVPIDRNFINSHSLSQLDISRCNVSSVTVETFANVSALDRLDLRYNKLRTVDIKVLRTLTNLSTLYLYNNPLQCDCQLQELWRWCEDRNIRTVHGGIAPKCDTPSEVQGLWWGVLEKGQCLDGNIQYYGDYKNISYIYTDIDQKNAEEYDVEFLRKYQIPLFVFPFIFGTTSNVILLMIIISNKEMRTVPNMYILNLAISDMIYLTILFVIVCGNKISRTWLEVEFMCIFFPFCRRISIGLSAYSIAVFSFQRYRVTVYPMEFRVSSRATWRVTVATICGVWILAALFAVPTALSKYQCKEVISLQRTNYYRHVVVFELLVSCVLPLFVITFTYIMTACHLVESSRSIFEETQNPRLNTRRNTAKIVVGLTVVFLISYVPYHAYWVYVKYAEKDASFRQTTFQYTYLISSSFLLINSCLNPVALFCTSSPFRQHLKRYLSCFSKTNSPPTDLELRRRV